MTESGKILSGHCPNCKVNFACNPNDISNCNCSKIVLTTQEYRYINSKYSDCLCNSCLNSLKDEYNANFSFNKVKNFNRSIVFIFILLCSSKSFYSQTYASPVGQSGTSAINKDSSAFVNWVSSCVVTRGYQDISNQSLGFATVGDNSMALGKAGSNAVVSLGDGGTAICTFPYSIRNGPGYDFAVFENGFDDIFLELAFVEVSSDGISYFRFPSHSLTDASIQTESFGFTDAKKINNLAGKYRGGYGTPFDLQELDNTPGLNINAISHVKVLDVVGSINPLFANYDSQNNVINDPWPTAFPSGGFDLDAIGVIHENKIVGLNELGIKKVLSIYPNPASQGETISINFKEEIKLTEVFDVNGSLILKSDFKTPDFTHLLKGIYFLKISTSTKFHLQKLIIY